MSDRLADDPLGRILGFLRARPMIPDAVIAAVFALVGFPSQPGASWRSYPQAVYGLIVLACCIALVFRRRYPMLVLTILAGAMLAHIVVVRQTSAFAGLVCALAVFTTQTHLARPWRWWYLLTIYLGSGAAFLLLDGPVVGTNPSIGLRLIQASSIWTALTVVALAGAISRHRSERMDLALERAQLLEARHETERQLAASQERARIAREIHDVLGHSLNVIAIQTEGARHVLRHDPEAANTALAEVAKRSRAAVDEVRSVIDVLGNDGDIPAPLHPAPGIADITALAQAHRVGSTEINLRVDGDLDSVPDAAGFAAYRIVQEALTNATVHADGAAILCEVHAGTGGIDLAVINGAGTARPGTQDPARTRRGLAGMRERAHALGGSLEAGPDRVTGGWKVLAHIPARAT